MYRLALRQGPSPSVVRSAPKALPERGPAQRPRRRATTSECGVSLILVMLALLILSVLAAAIVFTARSEAYASHNYMLNTEADYLAKAGIQQAVNWFRSARYQAVTQSQAATYYNVAGDGSTYSLSRPTPLPSSASPGARRSTARSS